jgi:hypothetical protein
VDLSGLIFVALAVAWAAYLIPKALRHHDDVVRGRSVDRFSQSMRVLARREPVSARAARLVVRPARTTDAVQVTTKPSASGEPEPSYAGASHARRAAAARATRRRRWVLALLLVALLGVLVACATHRLAWACVAIPTGLLVAWLVACRLMVKKERRWRPVAVEAEPMDDTSAALPAQPIDENAAPMEPPVSTEPGLWDPVPVTLPTYVSKPPARRTVRTIDLDSTGVWTSGRTEADSALAREAEAAERVRRRTARKGDADEKAVGS